jgi:uncharacterized protein (TIGR03000 family)
MPYYSSGLPDAYYDTTPRLPEEYAPPMPPAEGSAGSADGSVRLTVRVPAEAEIFVDGVATKQAGSTRKFVSPPLTAGQDFTYELTARWTENGREVVQTRRVNVTAGDRRVVDFTQADTETIAPPKPRQ